MDNYTLSIPLLFGILFGYIHHFNHLYVSNTKMIIRQSDQIQFLLTRIMELENKIKNLKSDTDIIIEDFLDTVEDDNDNDTDNNVLKEEDNVINKDVSNEKEFELVETSSTFKINKNNGWLRFIF